MDNDAAAALHEAPPLNDRGELVVGRHVLGTKDCMAMAAAIERGDTRTLRALAVRFAHPDIKSLFDGIVSLLVAPRVLAGKEDREELLSISASLSGLLDEECEEETPLWHGLAEATGRLEDLAAAGEDGAAP